MQENNKNASILILSIILSLILWVIFISLSNKISLNLRQNSNFIEKISNEEKIEKNLRLIENELKNILKEIKNQNPNQKNITKTLEEIDNLKDISDEIKIVLDLKIENFALTKNSDFIEFYAFPESNLKIKNFWEDIQISSKNMTNDSSKIDEKNEVALESAIVTTNDYFKKINIKNIWWYSKIDIISSNYFIPQKKYFQIVEKFGKKEILKKDWFLNIN